MSSTSSLEHERNDKPFNRLVLLSINLLWNIVHITLCISCSCTCCALEIIHQHYSKVQHKKWLIQINFNGSISIQSYCGNPLIRRQQKMGTNGGFIIDQIWNLKWKRDYGWATYWPGVAEAKRYNEIKYNTKYVFYSSLLLQIYGIVCVVCALQDCVLFIMCIMGAWMSCWWTNLDIILVQNRSFLALISQTDITLVWFTLPI
jgi:hypothetical protein